MSSSFTNYPSSGPDAGAVRRVSPAPAAGLPASEIDASHTRLYNRAARRVPANGMWVDDPSIVSHLLIYQDSESVRSSIGTALANWPDWSPTGSEPLTQSDADTRPIVVQGRNGRPAVSFNMAGISQGLINTTLTLHATGTTIVYVFDDHQCLPNVESPLFQADTDGGGDKPLALLNASNNWKWFGGSYNSTGLPPVTPEQVVLVIRMDGSQTTYWVNGDLVAHGNIPYNNSITITGMSLARGQSPSATQTGFGAGLAVEAYLFAAYDTALTDDQIAAINKGLVAYHVDPARTSPDRDLLICDGDSRMAGTGANYNGRRLPDLLKTKLSREIAMVNLAVPATSPISKMDAVTARPYASLSRRRGVVFVQSGINGLGGGAGNGAAVFGNLVTWATNLRSLGYKVAVSTVYPYPGMASDARTQLAVYNAAITADTTHFDAIVDLAGNSSLMLDGDVREEYRASGPHINMAGNEVCAVIAAPILAALFDS